MLIMNSLFNTELQKIIDSVAPFHYVNFRVNKRAAWFDND